jgi:rfaE bifunctional protein nucleotidyltransferase chain/domain
MILRLEDVPAWTKEQKEKGRVVVATNGCFDLLHVGHIRYLQQARALGDCLIVGVNADASVRQIKGPERPLNNEKDRAEVLAALSCVDAVAIFPDMRADGFLCAAEPSIYAKGGDYTRGQLDKGEVEAVESRGGAIRILPLVPGKSTTSLVTKMKS